jgi:hypothetical protein
VLDEALEQLPLKVVADPECEIVLRAPWAGELAAAFARLRALPSPAG